MKSLVKWLVPGLRVKRWLFICWVGLLIFSSGSILMVEVLFSGLGRLWHMLTPLQAGLIGVGFILLGFVAMAYGMRGFSRIIYGLGGGTKDRRQMVDVLYERHQLQRGLKIVTIGGGTGLASLLRGLKAYTSNLVAVVTVSDDGGSSGRLSKELGVLPPGDVRNCLVALADDESLLGALFRHRFVEGGLEGHSFGNLFLAAMTEVAGDFELAVELSSQILATRGRVLPATLTTTVLCARYIDGTVVQGESQIPHKRERIEQVYLEPSGSVPPAQVLAEIAEADAIVLGPGSLYTSVLPNLLVEGMVDAVLRSPAPKIYACNVMTQPGETDGFSAGDHLDVLLRHAGVPLVDYALVNLAFPASRLTAKYKAEGADPVLADLARIEKMGIEPIGANLISETELVRHDSERLARAIIDLIARHRSKEVEPGSAGLEFRRLRAVK